ncbi:MAG: ABC transporter [Thermoleophilia bacterium]|nr:ABC transporter [Thermoleophilia bacterium]
MNGIDIHGWSALTRLLLRTSRLTLTLWPLLIGVLAFVTARSVSGLYDTPEKRALYAQTVTGSAVQAAFNGRAYDVTGVGGIAVYELGFYSLLVFPAIAVHMAVHLTRSQEDAGRLDILTASRLGRTAPLAAAFALLAAALGGTGVLTWAGLTAAGLPAVGSAWFAAATVASMAFFAALGVVAAQVAQDARGAHGLGGAQQRRHHRDGLGVMAGLYLVRAAVDGRGWNATWVSPSGWFPETRPFGDTASWPLVAYAAGALALAALAAVLNVRRDLGAGLVVPRPGPPRGAAALGTPFGLTWRLNRGALLAWMVGIAVWEGIFGSLTREMRAMIERNPGLREYFGVTGSPDDLMTSMAALMGALLAAGVGIQVVGRLAGEEIASRAAVVMAAPVSRVRWWAGAVGVALTQAGVVALVGGVALGVGAWMSTGDAAYLRRAPAWALAYLPAVALVTAAAAVVAATRPRWHAAGWAVFGWVLTVAMLAGTLRMSPALRGTSPQEHVGRIPAEPLDVAGVVIMAAVSVALLAASAALFRRRDLAA